MKKANLVPFRVKKEGKMYTKSNSKVQILEDTDKYLVEITKQFPSPGYQIDVDRVEGSEDGKYNIYVDIKAPDSTKICLQVITYKKITIEIDKKDINTASHNFNVEFNG